MSYISGLKDVLDVMDQAISKEQDERMKNSLIDAKNALEDMFSKTKGYDIKEIANEVFQISSELSSIETDLSFAQDKLDKINELLKGES